MEDTRTSFVILTYCSPSVIRSGSRETYNSIDYTTPGDMPHNYLFDACPVGVAAFKRWFKMSGLYYEALGDVLKDGWEPISVGEHVGGEDGYGRLYAFKKAITYASGHYRRPEQQ